jgi:hypothetical protein
MTYREPAHLERFIVRRVGVTAQIPTAEGVVQVLGVVAVQVDDGLGDVDPDQFINGAVDSASSRTSRTAA